MTVAAQQGRAVLLGIAALLAGACGGTEQPAAPVASGDVAPTVQAPTQAPAPAAPALTVRLPAVAGSWYPDDAAALAAQVKGYLDKGGPADCSAQALVLPHAGYRFSGPTAGLGVSQVRGCNVRRVWVLGPAHKVGLSGVGLYPQDAFRTPLGDLPLDTAVIGRLAGKPGFLSLDKGDGGEHSIEMELPLLTEALGAFELVPLLVGQLTPELAGQLADAIRPELGPGDLVVVSSDFTHFGPNYDYAPFAEDVPEQLDRLDHRVWSHVAQPDTAALWHTLDKTGATVCGRHPLLLLTALLPPGSLGTELSYTTSGAITGDWTNSVSYLTGRLDGPAWSGAGPSSGIARLVSDETAAALHALAQRSLEFYFATGQPLQTDGSGLPAGSERMLGAFVTLTRDGELRGCIGEITPQRPAWQAVLERAVDAAVRDPRFPPVTADEWPTLEVEVTLLGPTVDVAGPQDVILGRHGVVLSLGQRRATFLPQVAVEQGWDRAATFAALAHKAGIPATALGQATVQVYEGQVVGHHP